MLPSDHNAASGAQQPDRQPQKNSRRARWSFVSAPLAARSEAARRPGGSADKARLRGPATRGAAPRPRPATRRRALVPGRSAARAPAARAPADRRSPGTFYRRGEPRRRQPPRRSAAALRRLGAVAGGCRAPRDGAARLPPRRSAACSRKRARGTCAPVTSCAHY